MFILNEQLVFPPVETADEDGIVAIGGDLSVSRLLLAYRSGIFPWYNEEEPIIWWSPDPRFVLFPGDLQISKSMKAVIKSGRFRFSTNQAFTQVIQHCKNIPRQGQDGTWITTAVEEAYTNLHRQGIAISAETWQQDQLVGGLYGLKIGNVFFGESMFSLVSNASKFAFIQLVQQVKAAGVILIDCQVYTAHLESLGAAMIDREDFIELLEKHC